MSRMNLSKRWLALLLLSVVQAQAGAQAVLRNANIEMRIGIDNGITLEGIRDVRSDHDYVSRPTFLFEFSVDGAVWQSNNGLVVDDIDAVTDRYLAVTSHCPDNDLTFITEFILTPGETAVHVKNHVINPTIFPLFVRMVFPKIHGLVTPGQPADTMAAIPQEVGAVVPLQIAPPGADLASAVRTSSRQTDAFVIGNDGAVWTVFEKNDAGWSMPLRIGPPGLAPTGGSLCAIANSYGGRENVLFFGNDGALYDLHQTNDSGWTINKVTLDGQAPAGAGVTVVPTTANSAQAFYIGNSGGIKAVELHADGAYGLPFNVTSAGIAPPGGQIAGLMQAFGQMRVVAFANNGRLASAFKLANSNWSWEYAFANGTGVPGGGVGVANHINNSSEVSFVGTNGKLSHATWINQVWFAPQVFPGADVFQPGARVNVCRRSSAQLDTFVVGFDGAVWTGWLANTNGFGPLPISGAGLAPSGRGVTAAMQTPTQQDAFVLGHSGTPWLSFETDDGAWNPAVPLETTIGMPLNLDIGLPTAMNSMEVATLYDRASGKGLFFACLGGNLKDNESPLQFTASSTTLAAFWTAWVPSAEYRSMPTLAIGVTTENDWHGGVDYYTSFNKQTWLYPSIPAWLREAGAVYSHSGAGAGGILMSFPPIKLIDHIVSHNFRDLDQLLDEAKTFGTDVVYLWDYWEGENESGRAPYFNKGDYIIRQDMGGPTDFKIGIDKIHARGGKIICYLESFIIYYFSQVGKDHGEDWAARRSNGGLDATYEDCYTMTGLLPAWQDFIAAKAVELVQQYGIDGIFLDSAGWQMNRPVYDRFGNLFCDSKLYSVGVLALVQRVRDAVRTVKPDFAVVLGETTSGQMNQVWDGGLSADLSRVFPWMYEANQGRIVASPVRYGNPERPWFTNGEDLNGLNQMFAAGHNLVLCNAGPESPHSFMKDEAQYIKKLVDIRKKYKDALVYGQQVYQPRTQDPDVAAYVYRGTTKTVITIANTNPWSPYTGTIKLRSAESASKWRDLVSEALYGSSGSELRVTVPPGGLAVLVKDSLRLVIPRSVGG